MPAASESAGDTVAVIDQGWHTDIAIPAGELHGGLSVFRTIFPAARTLVFGFGKRTFMIAPVHSVWDYAVGPVPGAAAVEVSALSVPARTAFGTDRVAILALPPGGAAALSDYVWASIAHDPQGRPRLLDAGPWPGSLFYDSTRGYSLGFTCNTWSAAALRRAGLAVDADVHLAHGLLDQLRQAPRAADAQRQGGAEPSAQTTAWPFGTTM